MAYSTLGTISTHACMCATPHVPFSPLPPFCVLWLPLCSQARPLPCVSLSLFIAHPVGWDCRWRQCEGVALLPIATPLNFIRWNGHHMISPAGCGHQWQCGERAFLAHSIPTPSFSLAPAPFAKEASGKPRVIML